MTLYDIESYYRSRYLYKNIAEYNKVVLLLNAEVF